MDAGVAVPMSVGVFKDEVDPYSAPVFSGRIGDLERTIGMMPISLPNPARRTKNCRGSVEGVTLQLALVGNVKEQNTSR